MPEWLLADCVVRHHYAVCVLCTETAIARWFRAFNRRSHGENDGITQPNIRNKAFRKIDRLSIKPT